MRVQPEYVRGLADCQAEGPAAAVVPYADQERAGVVRRNGPAFVEPLPRAVTPARVEVLPPAVAPDLAGLAAGGAVSRAESRVSGGYEDRARGFALVVNRLGLALGGLGVLVAVLGFKLPPLGLGVLGWFGGLYAGTWLAAYVVHVAVSPEGAALLHVRRGWAWLDREQAHRHEIERHANGLERGGRR